MKLSRPSRIVTAFIVLFSMLFMQYAVASYACPGMEMGQAREATMSSDNGNQNMQGMPDCEGMDAKQPGLCHAHDQAGNQSHGKPELPNVQPFMAAALTLILRNIEVAYNPVSTQPDSILLARATAPPLSIRNCCFRI